MREAGGSSSLNPQWDADERWDGICELSVAAGTAPGVLICSATEVENLAGTARFRRLLCIFWMPATRAASSPPRRRGAIVSSASDEKRAGQVARQH